MTNPFDDANSEFYILINSEGQHSLWPTFVDVPTGWTVARGPASRQECLDYVNRTWVDIRPLSLARSEE